MSGAEPIDQPGQSPFPVPYVYHPLKESEIRLLTLYPGEETEEVCISLSHFELQHINPSTAYEALSYTWGAPPSGRYVLVKTGGGDGEGDDNDTSQRIIPITDNLAVALRRLRDKATAKTLWIDALCIDQSDDNEKSIQVQGMGTIYKSAARVIVWLGPERDESALVMQLIEFIAARVKVNWVNGEVLFSGNYMDEVHEEFGAEIFTFTVHVESLLGREWFERVWVRQEVFLARQAVVFCGASEVGWIDFKDSIWILAYTLCKPQSHQTIEYIVYIFSLSLPELSYALKGTKCNDPRDRIYGMLALIESNEEGLPEVDYSLSTSEVYTAVAVQYYQRSTCPDLLMSCELAPGRLSGLPSWVPDWSSDLATKKFLSGSFTAMDTNFCVKFPVGISGVIRFPGVMKNASMVNAVEMMGSTRSQTTDAILRLLRKGLAAQDEDVGRIESLVEALCCAILCDRFMHRRIPQRTLDTTLRELRVVERYLLSLLGIANSDNSSNEYTAHYEQFLETGHQYWTGRALFLTEDGLIGLGPLSTSPGDMLFIPWGSRFPVLICPAPGTGTSGTEEKRERQGDQWLVVGPCFVNGLMSGEVLYGPLPPDYCVIRRLIDIGLEQAEIHKVVIEGDCVVSTMRDETFERERVKQAFGVDHASLVTPEMAISKGVPVTWVDFI